MNTTEILTELSELNSIYGVGARAFINDKKVSDAFIYEIYEDVVSAPLEYKKAFGLPLCIKIIEYCTKN